MHPPDFATANIKIIVQPIILVLGSGKGESFRYSPLLPLRTVCTTFTVHGSRSNQLPRAADDDRPDGVPSDWKLDWSPPGCVGSWGGCVDVISVKQRLAVLWTEGLLRAYTPYCPEAA
jgi:hypothetical protein